MGVPALKIERTEHDVWINYLVAGGLIVEKVKDDEKMIMGRVEEHQFRIWDGEIFIRVLYAREPEKDYDVLFFFLNHFDFEEKKLKDNIQRFLGGLIRG